MLAFALLSAVLLGAEPVPENVKAFKKACDAEKASAVKQAERDWRDSRNRLRNATNEDDRSKFIKETKKALEKFNAVKESAWYSYPPAINRFTDGSIGEFYKYEVIGMVSTPKISIQFRPDLVESDRVIGAIIIHGRLPQLVIRQGGQVAKDVYSKPGETTYAPAEIHGDFSSWKAGKSETLTGLFEVISADPLQLKPFDIEPYKKLK